MRDQGDFVVQHGYLGRKKEREGEGGRGREREREREEEEDVVRWRK